MSRDDTHKIGRECHQTTLILWVGSGDETSRVVVLFIWCPLFPSCCPTLESCTTRPTAGELF